jgi:hypothetical protein
MIHQLEKEAAVCKSIPEVQFTLVNLLAGLRCSSKMSYVWGKTVWHAEIHLMWAAVHQQYWYGTPDMQSHPMSPLRGEAISPARCNYAAAGLPCL